MNVLIIEDNESHLKLAHLVLSAAGHNVNDAHMAEQAFSSIKVDRPEVILMDLNLPGMDGLTLIRKLKSEPTTQDIHIVAITSYPDRFTKFETLAAGCDAFIVKPISTRTLSQQLAAVVKGDGNGKTAIS